MISLDTVERLFPIEGKLVRISIFTEENITDTYLSWLNDPEVVRFSNQRFFQHTYHSSLDYLRTFVGTTNIFLAVYLKDEDKYVGTMSVYFLPPHEVADIGIMIGDRDCWGKGIGGDAWTTVLSLLIDVVGIRKVTGGTLSCNKGMLKILAKSGMKPDGVRVRHELVNGQEEDAVLYAKFKRD